MATISLLLSFYRYKNEGPMNHIALTCVVSIEDVISDLDSFIAVMGFNPFVA